jgi:hypothetical protein
MLMVGKAPGTLVVELASCGKSKHKFNGKCEIGSHTALSPKV